MAPKEKGIKTTGQFRRFLLEIAESIRDGNMDPDKATSICKAAAQVNNNLIAELKLQKLAVDCGKDYREVGSLIIDNRLETLT